jgi:serine/threonine protein kinase
LGSATCPKCLLSLGLTEEPQEFADLSFLLDSPRPPDLVKFFSFGDFELLEEIARGGMGVVFRARQRSLHRIVALKLVRAGSLPSISTVRRFRLEAHAAASLSHPNIVPIYEIGEYEGRHYFTMKFLPESLAGRIAKNTGSFPQFASQAAQLFIKLASAIHYAHEKGILHRDIKPANILFSEEGEPCVSDFGLAKLLDEDPGLTISGAVLGSPSYISPEQAKGLRHLTPATDVYGLGATLYEFLTGVPPFVGSTQMETLQMVQEDQPTPPRLHNQAIPRELEEICLTCLAKPESSRYATANALVRELRAFLANRDGSKKFSSDTAHPRQSGSVRGSVKIAASLILLLVCGSFLLRFRLSTHKIGENPLSNRIESVLLGGEEATRLADDSSRSNVGTDDLGITRLQHRTEQESFGKNFNVDAVNRARLPVSPDQLEQPTLALPAEGPDVVHQIRNNEVTVGFLANILKFCSFPDSAFTDATSPFIITTDDPEIFGRLTLLDRWRVYGRPLHSEFGLDSEALHAHVVYFADKSATPTELSKHLTDSQPTLTVSYASDFLQKGGMIQLSEIDGQLRFAINTTAVDKSGIVINSKFLRLAYKLSR